MPIQDAIARIPRNLLDRSGSLFYSGRGAFARPSELYLLGLNPGGSPTALVDQTIARHLDKWQARPASWSAYMDLPWGNKLPGQNPMQRRIVHMLQTLNLDPRAVPASNVVFVRSKSEATLEGEKDDLLRQCWPFHEFVIRELQIRTILCLGQTAGRWCRERIGANQLFGSFRERNAKGWSSTAHLAPDGRAVITVTHPARANWCNPTADPTPLVRNVLDRDRCVPTPLLPELVDNHQLRASDVPGVDASKEQSG